MAFLWHFCGTHRKKKNKSFLYMTHSFWFHCSLGSKKLNQTLNMWFQVNGCFSWYPLVYSVRQEPWYHPPRRNIALTTGTGVWKCCPRTVHAYKKVQFITPTTQYQLFVIGKGHLCNIKSSDACCFYRGKYPNWLQAHFVCDFHSI